MLQWLRVELQVVPLIKSKTVFDCLIVKPHLLWHWYDRITTHTSRREWLPSNSEHKPVNLYSPTIIITIIPMITPKIIIIWKIVSSHIGFEPQTRNELTTHPTYSTELLESPFSTFRDYKTLCSKSQSASISFCPNDLIPIINVQLYYIQLYTTCLTSLSLSSSVYCN